MSEDKRLGASSLEDISKTLPPFWKEFLAYVPREHSIVCATYRESDTLYEVHGELKPGMPRHQLSLTFLRESVPEKRMDLEFYYGNIQSAATTDYFMGELAGSLSTFDKPDQLVWFTLNQLQPPYQKAMAKYMAQETEKPLIAGVPGFSK